MSGGTSELADGSDAERLRSELVVLMLRFLEGDSRLTESFETFRRQAELHGLCGTSIRWTGLQEPASYAHAVSRFGVPPPDYLNTLLGQLICLESDRERADARLPAPAWSLLRTSQPTCAAAHRQAPRSIVAGGTLARRPLPRLLDALTRRRATGCRHVALEARESGVQLHLQPSPVSYRAAGPSGTPGRGASLVNTSSPSADGMRLLNSFVGHRSAVYCCTFDRTGRRLLTGADDSNVKIWSMESGLLQHTLRGHSSEITEVAVSPDNRWVVSASNDGTARVWSLADGIPEAVLSAHEAPVNSVAFAASIEARAMLSIGHNATMLLWDTSDWDAPPRKLRAGTGSAPARAEASSSSSALQPDASAISAQCCAVSPTGSVAAIGLSASPYLLLWLLDTPSDTGEEVSRQLVGHGEEVTMAVFSHRGDALLTASRDGTARVWHWEGLGAATYRHTKLLAPEAERNRAHGAALAQHAGGKPLSLWMDMVAWSADDRLIFTSESFRKQTSQAPCVSSCIRVWAAPMRRAQPAEPRLLHTLQPDSATKAVYVLQPHPHDVRVMCSAGYDGVVRLWDVRAGEELCALRGPQDASIADDADAHALLDASWAPGGDTMVASTMSAECHVFGLFERSVLARAPDQQFWASDFNQLVYDDHRNALDVIAGRMPHRVDRGPLCTFDLTPHHAEFQQPASGDRLTLDGYEHAAARFRIEAEQERSARMAEDRVCTP